MNEKERRAKESGTINGIAMGLALGAFSIARLTYGMSVSQEEIETLENKIAAVEQTYTHHKREYVPNVIDYVDVTGIDVNNDHLTDLVIKAKVPPVRPNGIPGTATTVYLAERTDQGIEYNPTREYTGGKK